METICYPHGRKTNRPSASVILTYICITSFCSLGSNSTSRAYLNFVTQEDLIEFTETFDGYVFVDSKGLKTSITVDIDRNKLNKLLST